MPQKTLRFKIHQDGRVEQTVEGFIGHSCNEATKNLEDDLGKVTFRNLAIINKYLSIYKNNIKGWIFINDYLKSDLLI